MKLTNCAFATATALLLVASNAEATPSAGEPMVQKARAIIAHRLVDPSSLRVRSTHVISVPVQGKTQKVLCGEYNAKNKMGGYAGFETFVYEPTTLKGIITFNSESFGFFAADGGLDLDSDPGPAIKAGVPASALSDLAARTEKFAEVYLPACLGARA